MKRTKPWILTVAVAALALSFVTVALAQPSPPSAFTGTVTSPDGDVATGLSVEAYVGDTLCTNSSVDTYTNSAGATAYFVTVHNASTRAGCAGDIRFEIGGQAAAQTAQHGGSGPVTLNLTLAPAAPESVTINVTVWRSVRTGNTFISTQAPGERWVTHNTPIDLSNLSSSGNFYQGSEVPVEVNVGTTITINVTVWRSVRTGNTFISTQAPGERWITHNTPIDLSNLSSSGNFYQGSEIPVEVDLQ